MMKQLVFALMLETLTSDGFVIETTEYGVWADINKCTFFSRSLTLQGVEGTAGITFREAFPVPLRAYCKPKFVDPTTTEIFK